MELTQYFPRDFEALQSLVLEAVEGVASVVMQTGHFLLCQDDVSGNVLPCLDEALGDPRFSEIRKNYGQFPRLTWHLGLQLLSVSPVQNKQVLVIVNDWEYLSKIDNRQKFYSEYKSLPRSYQQELDRYKGRIELLKPSRASPSLTGPFYSEQVLRNSYQQHVAQLISEGRLPPQAVVRLTDSSTYCSLPDAAGRLKEAYCSGKPGDCAGEVAELIFDAVSQTGPACFINLYPLVCRKFVDHGAQLAVDLFGTRCKSILNIGFPSSGVNDWNDLFATAEASLFQSAKQ